MDSDADVAATMVAWVHGNPGTAGPGWQQRRTSDAMTKLFIALGFVALLLIGGLMQLLRNSSQPMGTPEQLERAKQRNRELEAQERLERED
jgi:hypothetical protein